jgi:glyoxylase-like metal-dependent hydrolase (beta-lactamase superfamily II)
MVEPTVSHAIDVMHLGRERVICAYEVDGLVVDPGPASCLEALLDGLGATVPRALLLTHVHLDHAGAAGVLVRRFPELTVYVHERGAPHVVDPSKLVASAGRLYGDDMERMWGEVAPVPEANVRALAGGETVEGFRVGYTPGHASHHVCYLHEETGDAYVGDMAGVRIPPSEYTVPPTPPPDVDLQAWRRSLDLIEEWAPGSLRLTHFGPLDAPGEQLELMRKRLAEFERLSRAADEESFVESVETEIRTEALEDTAGAYLQALGGARLLWLGLERYWQQRAAGDTVDAR